MADKTDADKRDKLRSIINGIRTGVSRLPQQQPNRASIGGFCASSTWVSPRRSPGI